MKAIIAALVLGSGLSTVSNGQGFFGFTNPNAATHIGSIDGPLADADIWGQALAGLTPDSLTPVGIPRQHYRGYVVGGDTFVPFSIPGFPPKVFVQMAAWDGEVWGGDFTKVPSTQIGYTDIVLVQLDVPPGPLLQPNWTQSAIVPLVPEPSTWLLAVLGTVLWCIAVVRSGQLPGHSQERSLQSDNRKVGKTSQSKQGDKPLWISPPPISA